MNEEIYIPKLKKGVRPIFLFFGSILSMFVSVFIILAFILLAAIFEMEYTGITLPFITLFGLGLWVVIMMVPAIKAATKLLTTYHKDKDGNITRYRIDINNVTSFQEDLKGAAIGASIGGLSDRSATGMVTGQQFVKIAKGISLNTNREFVVANLQNEDIFKVKKVYRSSDNFQIPKHYETIHSVQEKQSVPKLLTLKYTLLVSAVLFGANLLLFGYTLSADPKIKEEHEEIAQNYMQELQPFGYENTSVRQMEFLREDGGKRSTIKLSLTNAGDIKGADVNIYWDLTEDANYVLDEIKTIVNIIGLEYKEAEYIEGLAEVQNASGLGYIERIDDYGIYLTKSSGMINLVLHNK